MKNENNINIVATEDGSPTAYFNAFEGEKMHHSGGAFGESVYIYGPAIQWGFAKTEKPRVVSLGTGLAYNEILSAAFSIIFDAQFMMTSFEKNKELNQSLVAWLLDKNSDEVVPGDVYTQILKMTSELFDVSAEQIKLKLKKMFEDGTWKVEGEWQPTSEKYNVVLYDFFSSKAMEKFWEEEFLINFLKEQTADKCAFATYACTGNLKRAFKTCNFQYRVRDGFMWKRHSTFASKINS